MTTLQEMLAPLQKEGQQLEGVSVQSLVLAGQPDPGSVGSIVANKAKELQASMIVVPRSGKGRLREAFVGSTR
jgi:nucleotide-binding universal stress UspA family protein